MMRVKRFGLISFVTLAVVLGLAVFWLLAERPVRTAAGSGAHAAPQPAHAAAPGSARTEVRPGREFRLEELLGFDPDLAPWPTDLREGRQAPGPLRGGSIRPPEQVASLPDGPGASRTR